MSSADPAPLLNDATKVKPSFASFQPRKARASRIPPAQWENLRPTIQNLYGSHALKELMQIMGQELGFHATKAQYTAQFRKWGMSKRPISPKGSVPVAQFEAYVSDDLGNKIPLLEAERGPEAAVCACGNCIGSDKICYLGLSADSTHEIAAAKHRLSRPFDEPDTWQYIRDLTQDSSYYSIANTQHDNPKPSRIRRPKSCVDSGYSSIDSKRHNIEKSSGLYRSQSSRNSDSYSISGRQHDNLNFFEADPDDIYLDNLQPDLFGWDERAYENLLTDVSHMGKVFYESLDHCDGSKQHEISLSDADILPWSLPRQAKYREKRSLVSEAGPLSPNQPLCVNRDGTAQHLKNQDPLRRDRLDSLTRTCQDLGSLSETTQRADFHSLNVSGRSPSYVVGHKCLTDPIPPHSPPPISSKVSQGEGIMPVREDSTDFSELNCYEASDDSNESTRVDLSDDVYRNALDCFLEWIDREYMPQLLSRFNKIPRILLSESLFRSHTTGNNSQGALATPSDSTLNSSQGTGNAKGKRKFASPHGPAGQEVQNDEQALKSSAVQKKKKFKLACHFYKRNPSKFSQGRYKTCPSGFDGLNRLKDHQVYVHKLAHYCKRCKLIFKTQDQKDAHDDQDDRCERREDPFFADFLTTDEQRAALAQKKPVGMKDEDFWYKMWDKYFPGEEHPQSPSQDLDRTLVAFRSFAERETLTTIQAYHAYNPEHFLTADELAEFWQFAIQYVVANFASQQRSLSSPDRAPSPVLSRQQQPNVDIVDLMQLPLDDPSLTWPGIDPAIFGNLP